MSYKLPDEWYTEESMQRLVLDPEKVAAEIERLRAALKEVAAEVPGFQSDGYAGACLESIREITRRALQ